MVTGEPAFLVDPGILTFNNHGCNGTYNVGRQMNVTELTADPKVFRTELREDPLGVAFFNPSLDRQHWIESSGFDFLHVSVEPGTEILDNYLAFILEEQWQLGVEQLRAMCTQQELGSVSAYEEGTAADHHA